MTPEKHVELTLADVELGECIGAGSFGQVFEADYRLRKVAVKFIQQSKRKDFESELAMLSSLSHPFLIGFYGACTVGKAPFLVLELAATNLSDYIRSHEYSLDQLYKWGLQISEAMHFLHSKNIVHRDLKTSNVLLDDRNEVKLCDFGSSRNVDMTLMAMTFTGTLSYMAPELLREQPSTKKIDCYSFGVVLWELLTKQYPFEGMQPLQIIWLVAAEGRRLPIPDSVPAVLREILEASWATEPNNRLSFQELIIMFVQEIKSRRLNPAMQTEEEKEEKSLKDYQAEWSGHIDQTVRAYVKEATVYVTDKAEIMKKLEELNKREEDVKKREESLEEADQMTNLRRFRSDPSPSKLRPRRAKPLGKSRLGNVSEAQQEESVEEETPQ